MPGLLGIVKHENNLTSDNFLRARELLKYHPAYHDDALYEDDFIMASRTHLNLVGEDNSPYISDSLYCWVEGEVYNFEEIRHFLPLETHSFPDLLLKSYRLNMLSKILANLDGYFVAVLYNKQKHVPHLISDRYGLKPLYIWSQGKFFGWMSEVKTLSAIPYFNAQLSRKALECFVELKHVLGNITYFKHVQHISAATIANYHIIENTFSEKTYWNWSKISPQKITFDEAALQLGSLLTQAVQKRTFGKKSVGVALSGGLDSRALLAADIKSERRVQLCYTFGKRFSEDISLAKKVAAVHHHAHQIFPLNRHNWFYQRLEGIWQSEGLLSLFHLNAVAAKDSLRNAIQCNLNGFLGDALEGGSYLNGIAHNCRITESIARTYYGDWYSLDIPSNHFYEIQHIDPYLLNNRGRRFIHAAVVESSTHIEQLLPFLDNALLEFLYSLPDEYRVHGKIYNAALLQHFPEYFSKIPWQKTGQCIGTDATTLSARFKRFVLEKRRRIKHRLNLLQFTEFHTWLRQPDMIEFCKHVLKPKDSLYHDILEFDAYNTYLLPHLQKKKDYTFQIGRLVSIEVWLQQFFHQRYRENKF